uniref:Uncharacterized protein n=1 Tax=Arion vulgaris TaxID=1028688 RepID=A0A0B7A4G1_9EUPU
MKNPREPAVKNTIQMLFIFKVNVKATVPASEQIYIATVVALKVLVLPNHNPARIEPSTPINILVRPILPAFTPCPGK